MSGRCVQDIQLLQALSYLNNPFLLPLCSQFCDNAADPAAKVSRLFFLSLYFKEFH